MNIKKLTTYVAASLALIASGTAPTHAATFTTGALVTEGPLPTRAPLEILNELFNNPALVQSPGTFGLDQSTARFVYNVPQDVSVDSVAGVNAGLNLNGTRNTDTTGIVTDTGTTLRGAALARGRQVTTTAPNGKQTVDLALSSSARALLENGGGSGLNGALSFVILDSEQSFVYDNPNGLPANADRNFIDVTLSFGTDGTTFEDNPAQAGAGALASLNGRSFNLTPRGVKGNALFKIPTVRVPTNRPLPLRIAFGTAAGTPGVTVGQRSEGAALYGQTFRLAGLEASAVIPGAPVGSGPDIPLDQISAPIVGGGDFVDVAEAGEQLVLQTVPEPPATLGLLVLGAGLVGSTQLKKFKSARKKAVKL